MIRLIHANRLSMWQPKKHGAYVTKHIHTTRYTNSADTPDTVTPSIPLVLASASPRRRELLSLLGVPFTVVATNAEEQDDPVPDDVLDALPPCPLPVAQHPTLLAWRKVHAVWHQHHSPQIILGADTTVVLDNSVLNKPYDAAQARDMLAQLSGRQHTVYTGLCVCSAHTKNQDNDQDGQTHPIWSYDLVASIVTFALLNDNDIEAYVATGEPLDKAGAYGIQGRGSRLIRQVEGSFTSVVGLPLPATWRLLTNAGLSGLHDPDDAYTTWLARQGKEPLPCPPTLP